MTAHKWCCCWKIKMYSRLALKFSTARQIRKTLKTDSRCNVTAKRTHHRMQNAHLSDSNIKDVSMWYTKSNEKTCSAFESTATVQTKNFHFCYIYRILCYIYEIIRQTPVLCVDRRFRIRERERKAEDGEKESKRAAEPPIVNQMTSQNGIRSIYILK